MSGPLPLPGVGAPMTDSDDDDLVAGVDDLPDDLPNDALTPSEPQLPGDHVADTDVEAPVVGTPLTDADIDG